MADNHNHSTSGGIGVCGLLGVVFITLKLCHVIDWSWWWVTAPFWGMPVLILAVLIIVFIVAVVLSIFGVDTDKL